MNWMLLAAEAASETPVADGDGGWWKTTGLVLLGMLLMKLVSWAAAWIDGKGKEWISERLAALQDKVNQNSLMGQLQADDALFKMIEGTIPEALAELTATAKQDLKDGKLDKSEWKDIEDRIWARIKPQVVGGKNDYLEHSSFSDGKALVSWAVQKFFKKQEAKKEGLIE